MYCTECGTKNKQTAAFCKECGNTIEQIKVTDNNDWKQYVLLLLILIRLLFNFLPILEIVPALGSFNAYSLILAALFSYAFYAVYNKQELGYKVVLYFELFSIAISLYSIFFQDLPVTTGEGADSISYYMGSIFSGSALVALASSKLSGKLYDYMYRIFINVFWIVLLIFMNLIFEIYE